jgi:hypothetical protein
MLCWGQVSSLALSAIFVSASFAQNTSGPALIRSLHHDVSLPLRDLAAQAGVTSASIGVEVQQAAVPLGVNTNSNPNITLGVNIAGMSYTGAFLDADPNGAVGGNLPGGKPGQIVQWINARYVVLNKKTLAVVLAPTPAWALWTGFGGPCENTTSGDGLVVYDRIANRWVITHHSGAPAPYLQCFAVSATSDATGAYYRYSFQLTQQFPDWPKLGVWNNGYYITENLLNPTTFASIDAQVCVLDRRHMLSNAAVADAQCFQTGSPTLDYVLEPATLDGATLPPTGSPMYLLGLNTNTLDSLDLFQFKVNWSNPVNTRFNGPTSIPVPAFTQACHGGVCVPQPGTTQLLDGVGDRLMYRLAYRNFGDHEALVVNNSVNDPTGTFVGIQWYEIRSPATPVLYQSGTFMPDSTSRWMGSIAMDKMGNMMLGYSVSSSTVYPGIRFTGRLATDPLGTMEAESTIMNGAGYMTDSQWGDYTSMVVDPVDDCTFWYVGEYMPSSGRGWSTRIVSMKFTSCQ